MKEVLEAISEHWFIALCIGWFVVECLEIIFKRD